MKNFLALAAADEPCRVIVCGGDGTVMWVITELETHDINLEGVAIGVVPFGIFKISSSTA